MSKSVHIGVRLPPEVYKDVVKKAEREGRSFSNMVIQMLKQALTRKQ